MMLMMLALYRHIAGAGANHAHDACPVAAGLGQNVLVMHVLWRQVRAAVGGNDAHDARPVVGWGK